MDDLEIRFIEDVEIELREDGDGRQVEGYAAVWNSVSEDLGLFREVLEPRPFAAYLQSRGADVIATINHRRDIVPLARYYGARRGTLKLNEDSKGLHISFEAPRSATGDELVEGIRRGDMRGMSFAFRAEEETWNEKDGKLPLRRIKKASLHDISVVTNPAYRKTSVSVRSLPGDDILKALKERGADGDLLAAVACALRQDIELDEVYRAQLVGELVEGLSLPKNVILNSGQLNWLEQKRRAIQFERSRLTNDLTML